MFPALKASDKLVLSSIPTLLRFFFRDTNSRADKLEGKKTKLVLYTYDAFLFDYSNEDKGLIQEIVNILDYPVNIKQGKTYHGLEKL